MAEAASRASYLPLYHSYNGLLAERDDVLQQLVAETNCMWLLARGAWENEQAAARQDVANGRAMTKWSVLLMHELSEVFVQ